MASKKQIINLMPARTIDTEADPKQSRGPLELLNCYVGRSGEIRRRPGYTALSRNVNSNLGVVSTKVPTSFTNGLIDVRTLFDFNGAPAALGRVAGSFSGGTLTEDAYLRWDAANSIWRRHGHATQWSYEQEVLHPGDVTFATAAADAASHIRVTGAAIIGDTLCLAKQNADAQVIDVVFRSLSTGAVIGTYKNVTTGFTITNSVGAHVAAVGTSFYVFWVANNNGLYAHRFDNLGVDQDAGAAFLVAADVDANSAKFDYATTVSANGNAALIFVYKQNSTNLIKGIALLATEAQTYNVTLWDSTGGTVSRLGVFTVLTTGELYVAYANSTTNQVFIRSFTTAGVASIAATVLFAVTAANVQTITGTAATTTRPEVVVGYALNYTAGGITQAHNTTKFCVLKSTGALKTSTIVPHVKLIGRGVVIRGTATPPTTSQNYRGVYSVWSREHSTTNDFLLMGYNHVESETVDAGWTFDQEVPYVFAKFLGGFVGSGSSGYDSSAGSYDPFFHVMHDVIRIDATHFAYVVDRADRFLGGTPLSVGTSAPHNVFSSTLVTFDSEPEAATVVPYASGRSAVVDGSLVLELNEISCALGFINIPEIPTTQAGTAGATTNSVAQRFEYTDAVGDRYQSAPSDIYTDTTIVDGSADCLLATYEIDHPDKNKKVYLVKYALDGNDLITLRRDVRVYRNDGASGVRAGNDFANSTDSTREPLVEEAGIVEAVAPAGLKSLLLHGDRLYGISMDKPEELWHTSIKTDGNGWRFSDVFTLRVQGGGDSVALASLDEWRVVFKAKDIYAFSGTGPDELGSGSFTTPQHVSATVGVRDVNSVVSTSDGVYFKSANGIWLLTRSLGLEYIGEPVASSNAVVCTRAVHMPSLKQVRFVHASTNTILVWDYEHKVWSTFDVSGIAGGTIADAAVINDVFYIATHSGTVASENNESGLWLDNAAASNPATMRWGSEWVHLNTMTGFQRLRWIHILGEMPLRTIPPEDETATLSIYYDYSTTPAETVLLSQKTSLDLPNTGGSTTFEDGTNGDSFWTVGGAFASILKGSGHADFGTGAFRVTSGQGSATHQVRAPVPPGATLNLSARFKRVGGANSVGTVLVEWYGSAGLISTDTVATSAVVGTSYATVSGAVAVPAFATFCKIKISATCVGGATVYGDTVSAYWTGGRVKWECRIKPKRQKCEAIRIVIDSDTTDAANNPTDWRISQASLIVEVKDGKLNRLGKK